eukprot:7376409-Prymnesium_polylepis.1
MEGNVLVRDDRGHGVEQARAAVHERFVIVGGWPTAYEREDRETRIAWSALTRRIPAGGLVIMLGSTRWGEKKQGKH